MPRYGPPGPPGLPGPPGRRRRWLPAEFQQPPVFLVAYGSVAGTGTSRVYSLNFTPAPPGSTLLALATTNNASQSVTALTDSQGNVYTLDQSLAASPQIAAFHSNGREGGSGGAPTAALTYTDTFTLTTNAISANVSLYVIAVPTGQGVDTSALNSGASAAPSVSATPSVDSEIMVATFLTQNAGGWPTATGAGFTALPPQYNGNFTGGQFQAEGTGTAGTVFTASESLASSVSFRGVMWAVFPKVQAPVFPLLSPVANPTRRQLPSRGTIRSAAGPAQAAAPPPPVIPLHSPVANPVRQQPGPHGRTRATAGTYGQLGPPVTQLQGPVASAARRALPPRGTVTRRAGAYGQPGPPVRQLASPVAAVIRPLPGRGRNQSRTGAYGQLGPLFRALNHPVKAQPPVFRKGHSATLAGTYGQAGPALTPLRSPVANPARQALPRRGLAQWRSAFVPPPPQAGPPVYPLGHPAANLARQALPARGRPQSRTGTYGQLGPPFVPARQPIASRLRQALPRRGTTWWRAGTWSAFSGTPGPPVYPLGHPAGNITRQALPARGRPQSRAGVLTPILAGPPVYPWHGPVRARVPDRVRGGQVQKRYGTYGQAGPPVRQLQQPVSSYKQTPFIKGRTQALKGTFGGTGPVARVWSGPVRPRVPGPYRNGRCYTTFVYHPPPPPPALQAATSTGGVTDPRDGKSTVTDANTGAQTVLDPRDPIQGGAYAAQYTGQYQAAANQPQAVSDPREGKATVTDPREGSTTVI